MFQNAFPTLSSQHVGQTCSWCHTNALIKLRLISQFSSSPASLTLISPPPSSSHFPCLSSPLQLNLFNPPLYPNRYRWTECSKTFKIQKAPPQCHIVALTFTLKNVLMKSPGNRVLSCGPQSLRRPWEWKMLLQSTRSDMTALSNANTHGSAHIQKACFLFYEAGH